MARRRRPLREQIKKLDTRMARLQKKLGALESALADAALYDGSRQAELTRKLQEQATLRKELSEV